MSYISEMRKWIYQVQKIVHDPQINDFLNWLEPIVTDVHRKPYFEKENDYYYLSVVVLDVSIKLNLFRVGNEWRVRVGAEYSSLWNKFYDCPVNEYIPMQSDKQYKDMKERINKLIFTKEKDYNIWYSRSRKFRPEKPNKYIAVR